MWGHEHWNLANAPDLVTFGGKAGISGFFSTLDYKLNELGCVLEQRVDMTKLLNFGVTWKCIQNENLLSYVLDTSTFLKIELARVERDKGFISNIRGYGTFLGFDAPTVKDAQLLQSWFFKSGFHLLRCGPQTFGLRPALILGPRDGA